jgi:microcystin-dependent protein
MSNPFLGQLMLVGFNFAPTGWFLAQGQILAISQYTALFSLMGTTYGGNGTSNFQLPNLQGAVAIGSGQGPGLSLYDLGETGGSTSVTLLQSTAPAHNHTPMGRDFPAAVSTPGGNSLAETVAAGSLYSKSTSPVTAMSSSIVPSVGGSQPHNNLMPYLTLNWIIAFQGVFPSRS